MINLARGFAYTRVLEERLNSLSGLHAGCELNAQEALAEEVERRLDEVSERYEAELRRKQEDFVLLREQYEKLLDRFLLLNRSVPVTESIRTPSATAKGSETPQLTDLLDQSTRRTGPVASAREKAEAVYFEDLAKAETEGRKVPARYIGSDAADLSEEMAQ